MKTILRVNVGSALLLAALLSGGAALPDAPVADAAMRGDSDAVRTLLKAGADVNAAQGDGMTALHWAAERGNTEVASMLIYAGANVDAVTRIGHYTPLHLASKAGRAELIETLLAAGAKVDATTTNSGATALHFAAAAGNPDAVAVLLDHGAQVDVREPAWGQTPLIFAAAYNRADAIKVLLERGADPNVGTKAVDLGDQSAVADAARDRQREVLEAFGVGEDDQPTPSQARAAAAAAREVYRSGEVPEPEEEEDRGRADAITSYGGLTALLHATRQGHMEAVKALLDGGADIDKVSASDGTTPLLMSTINGQFDVAMLLIERGADPNIESTLNGVAPLWATINSYWQPRTRFPQPREHEAQNATYLEVMEALLQAGADPDVRTKVHPWYMVYGGCGNRNCGLEDTQGSTAFWRAAYGLDVEAMKLLVAYGADSEVATFKPPERRRNIFDPDAPEMDPSGLPPVPVGGPAVYPVHAVSGVGYGEGFAGNAHRTVPDNWMPALRYVVEELGADVNARDYNGYTPLHHAAARGDNEMILYLVEKGADVTVVSRMDQTVADMANGPYQRTSPYPATVQLLESLGSKNNDRCVTC